MQDANCLFCKIISGNIPCASVYEDDNVLAFLDINPIAPGHTLVVPKQHFATLLELPDAQAAPIMHALRRVGAAVQEATNADGFNILQNNFSAAGQVIFHVHFHIIPRFEGDALPQWAGKAYADDTAMKRMATAIASVI